MGVDIHMHIVAKNGKFMARNIYDVRNSAWFANLTDGGENPAYKNFPKSFGIPSVVPQEIKDDKEINGYFDFHYLTVQKFCEWFESYRPDKDAGWVHKYDEWAYINKGIYPEDICRYLDDEANGIDWSFIEVVDKYEPSRLVYEFIKKPSNFISPDDIIVYYFDC